MEIVYYLDKSSGACPVKKYLEQYSVQSKSNQKVQRTKLRLVMQIDDKILSTLRNNGRPIAPTAVPLQDYSLIEIKHKKNKNILIRIVYFCHLNKIVLLHAFEKPFNYNTTKERRRVIKQYDLAEYYRQQFIINTNDYEKY